LIQSANITENIFKIRSLKYLLLYSIDPIIFHFDSNSILPFTELEYIEIDDCLVVQFLELLKYVGSNVKRMKIRLLYDHQDETSISPTIIDEWLSHHQTSSITIQIEIL
jgi:mRNA-degrading endonuclease RelE of RelBE toxin-antitoxin system